MPDVGHLAISAAVIVACAYAAIGPLHEFQKGAPQRQSSARLVAREALFVAACAVLPEVRFIEPVMVKWALLVVAPVVLVRLIIWALARLRVKRRPQRA